MPESVAEMNMAVASQMSIAPMIAPSVNRTNRRSLTHAPTVYIETNRMIWLNSSSGAPSSMPTMYAADTTSATVHGHRRRRAIAPHMTADQMIVTHIGAVASPIAPASR